MSETTHTDTKETPMSDTTDNLTCCDPCGRLLPCVIGPLWSCGLEVYACHHCRGVRDEECDECRVYLDDRANRDDRDKAATQGAA